jgi:hypothetical protein
MSIVLQSSGGGSVTIAEPTTASNFTQTLPASTGSLVIQNGSNNLLMNSGYGSDATAYGCRAWVNFNGTGTVAIRASGNVSSITDNGTGNYLVNLTTAMPDANFGTTVTSGNAIVNPGDYHAAATNPSASTIDIRVFTTGTSAQDPAQCCVAVFR